MEAGLSEEVQYSRANDFPGLVLGTARFAAFRFEPHYHLDSHIGLIAEGIQRQSFRGESLILSRGTIQLMPAGEVHDGIAGANESYTLRTFRLSSDLLKGLGEEVTGKHALPSLAPAVVNDQALAARLLAIHRTLEASPQDPLLNDTRVLELFESLFARLLRPAPVDVPGTLSPQQLRRLREFMEAHIADKIVLDDLARTLNLDRFRFLKLFKRTVSMTPHAWLVRLRLEKAIEMIKAQGGWSIAEVAHAVGFFDQSHFTRAFRQAYGIAPSSF